MKKEIFICWSGNRSKIVAEALRDWIPNVIQFVEPWMSSKDIYIGDRWFSEVTDKLQNFKYGIICLTPENLNSSWIHFEAGALAKFINESSLCPYLIGLNFSDITGPLAHFQSSNANEIGTLELMKSINRALEEDSMDNHRLEDIFNRFWPDLQVKLSNLPDPEVEEEPKRDSLDISSEILELVRSLTRSDAEKHKSTKYMVGADYVVGSIEPKVISRIPNNMLIRKEKKEQDVRKFFE